jgi:type II secretory pathway pseudopilin PulG
MRRERKRGNRGFLLVEAMLALAIGCVVLVAIFVTVSQGRQVTERCTQRVQAAAELDRILAEVRDGRAPVRADGETAVAPAALAILAGETCKVTVKTLPDRKGLLEVTAEVRWQPKHGPAGSMTATTLVRKDRIRHAKEDR